MAVLTVEAAGGAWRAGLPAGEPDCTILACTGRPGRMACEDTGDWGIKEEEREQERLVPAHLQAARQRATQHAD
ncbi:hypothetical protein SKAU_G00352600 [Synaphobranchus kaupii]|uniref:Uncharacterized protein n=1 Tax=Synaphobranchus kaupii TaxID=118154 RepID=A0A9Q1EKU1_SYNKA|nr:hypothetical protein SKAU_G00352600 [Synaphobranchus kaupii]